MHSPTDICIGGLEGTLLGVLAFLLVCRILAAFLPGSALVQTNADQHVVTAKKRDRQHSGAINEHP